MQIAPEIFYGIGAVLLLLVIGWGVLRDKTRNRANDALTEAATRAEYDDPEGYKRKQKDFERQARG